MFNMEHVMRGDGNTSTVLPLTPACLLTLTPKAGKYCGHYSGSNINKYTRNELNLTCCQCTRMCNMLP